MQVPNVKSVPLFNIPNFDKIVHFSLYYILVNIWLSDYYSNNTKILKQQILRVAFISIFYGSVMEIVQKVIVQNRTGDIWDATANATGVVTGSLGFYYFEWYRKLIIRIIRFKKK